MEEADVNELKDVWLRHVEAWPAKKKRIKKRAFFKMRVGGKVIVT